MPYNSVAENVLGTIGTICWTIQLVPQIWKTWREKSTEGLSPWLIFLWGVAAGPLGVYNITQNINIPLILQPQLFGGLTFLSWAQYYTFKRPLPVCVAMYLSCLVLLAGFQVGFIYAIRSSYDHGNDRGVEFFGILASIIIAVVLLPQYYEIYLRGEVVGISISFMTVDMLGGVFSDLSLAFRQKFDVIAGVTYSVVVVMDAVVIILALILNPRAQRRRKREAAATLENRTLGLDEPREGTTVELTTTTGVQDPPTRTAPEIRHTSEDTKD